MALELKQHLKMAQQLVMTPQLQQAIKLLQLSRQELSEYIADELETNPLLEVEPEKNLENGAAEDEQLKHRWESYLETYGQDNIPYYDEDERPSFEATLSRSEGLVEHLLWQVRMGDLGPEELPSALFIVGNLDHNGYFGLTDAEACATLNVSPELFARVLAKVQTFDPVGIAARDLRDCLRIQARLLDLEQTLVWDIIEGHLENLQTKNYDKIAHDLDADVEDVAWAAQIICN